MNSNNDDFEFDDADDTEVFDGEAVEEASEEYGYVEPSTDVPMPLDYTVQNPDFKEAS